MNSVAKRDLDVLEGVGVGVPMVPGRGRGSRLRGHHGVHRGQVRLQVDLAAGGWL